MEATLVYLNPEDLKAIIRSEVSTILKEELKDLSAQSGTTVYMDIEKAADYICFSVHHLRKMCQRHKIIAHKVSGKWIFLKSDLDKFITRGRIFTDAEVSKASEQIINKILK
jgi:hypothetical protein